MSSDKTPKEQKQEDEFHWIKGLIVSAQKKNWYGKMIVEFKNGMVDVYRCEETLKPPKK